MADIKIMIVDDSVEIINYFTIIISNEPGMEVVGTATGSKEAITTAVNCTPDIILMDIEMETKTAGIDALKAIKELLPEVKVIMNTIYSDDEHIIKSYEAGAMDYITKSASATEILSVIKDAYNNSTRVLVAQSLANEMSKLRTQQTSVLYITNKLIKLTPSELQILKLVYSGMTYNEIAKKKFIEEATVRSFVNKILKKFESKNMKTLVKELKDVQIMELLNDNNEN